MEGADYDQRGACVRRPRRWLVPDLAHVRDEPTGTGKTTAHTDTYHGRFVKLVTNQQVVEVVEFETTYPALRGEMTITITLADADGGTDVLAVHDGLPRGLPTADMVKSRSPTMNRYLVVVAAVTLATAALAEEGAKPAAAAKEGGTPLMVSFTDLKWTELSERKGMQFAVLSGDPKKGEYTQMRKVPGGTAPRAKLAGSKKRR